MRRSAWAGPRGLGVRLQPAWKLSGQAAILAASASKPWNLPRVCLRCLGPDLVSARRTVTLNSDETRHS